MKRRWQFNPISKRKNNFVMQENNVDFLSFNSRHLKSLRSLPYLLLFFFVAGLRFYFSDVPQVFDSGFYMGEAERVFSQASVDFAGFNLFGHPTFLPVLILYVSNLIFDDINLSLFLVNNLFLFIGLCYLVLICIKIYRMDWGLLLPVVLLTLFQPIIISSSLSFVPDFWSAMLVFPLFYYCYTNKFWSYITTILVLMFTKEIGFILAVSSAMYYLIWGKRFKIFPLLFSVLLFVFNNSGIWFQKWSYSELSIYHPIAYFFNIVAKLDQAFLFNFGWIATLIVFFYFFKGFTFSRIFSLEVFLLAGFLGFYSIFVTYSHPRYMAPFFAVFILVIARYVSHKSALDFILVVNVIACLVCIDPLSRVTAKIKTYQRGQIGQNFSSIYDKSGQNAFRDGSLYNLQFFYKFKTTQQYLAKNKVDVGQIYIPVSKENLCLSSLNSPFLGQLFCNNVLYPRYFVYYDQEKKSFRNSIIKHARVVSQTGSVPGNSLMLCNKNHLANITLNEWVEPVWILAPTNCDSLIPEIEPK